MLPTLAAAGWETSILGLGGTHACGITSAADLWHPQEEEMATYSSILAWKIPWTEGPRGL